MARGIDLPETVPLFPLPGAVLMPRTRLPLQIFEPRYLQMVEDVLKTPSRLIGMIQPAEGGLDALAQVGCAGRIVAFSELDDGRLMISLKARSRFRLNEVQPGFTPYLRGQVNWSGYETDLAVQPEEDPRFERKGFMARLGRYMEQRSLSTDWDAAERPRPRRWSIRCPCCCPSPPRKSRPCWRRRRLPSAACCWRGCWNTPCTAATTRRRSSDRHDRTRL